MAERTLGSRARSGLPADVLIGVAVVLVLARPFVLPLIDGPAVQTWFTIFVSISVQASPFLVLGVVLSGAVAAWVSPAALAKLLPSSPRLAVPVAGAAGLALPGCECGAVPLAGRLVGRGVTPAAALTFLLAAPAINPIVLVSTAVAFPGSPEVVLARFVASFVAAVVVGQIWVRMGREEWMERARQRSAGGRPWQVFTESATHDLLHAGGYLVLGAAAAATIQVVVPRTVLESLGGSGVASVLTMAVLAVVLSICSEADAFVAASLTEFSMTSRLVFMVVGPMVDLKLVVMQAGVFGAEMTRRFAPVTFVVATVVAVVVGNVLL